MKILNPQRQKGMALIMVLLFLVLLTGVSVWGVRKSILSEGMARNQLDKEAAREAAETALRDAERDIFNPTPNVANNASCSRGDWQITSNDFTADCRKGLCLMADSLYTTADWSKAVGGEVWWPSSKGGLWNNVFSEKPQRVPSTAANCDFTGGVPLGSFTGAAALKGVARQPEYIVEYFRRKNVRINLNETQVSSQGQKANQWSAMYRITARGFGYSANTQVVLQTVFFP